MSEMARVCLAILFVRARRFTAYPKEKVMDTVLESLPGQRRKKVGLAIQGGGFPAGAFAAGVIKELVNNGAFDHHDICAFSGTSAGALIAAVCWVNRLNNTVERIPEDLDRQWQYFTFPSHGAWFPMWTPAMAEWWRDADAQWMKSPLWLGFVQQVRTPLFRWLMQQWIIETIPLKDYSECARSQPQPRCERIGLVLGAADVLRGEIRSFREDELSLSTLLASGSLDDVNGMTTIVSGPQAGTYLDGAWGQNPPISELIDYGVEEIWLVQHFPSGIDSLPQTPAERRERRDELWQNSLVEHEMEVVELVSFWSDAINEAVAAKIQQLIDAGQLPREPEGRKEYLRRLHQEQGRLPKELSRLFDTSKDYEQRTYRKVLVRPITMHVARELGATVVNSPYFIANLMRHGEQRARAFIERNYGQLPERAEGMLPPWWAWLPSPINDFLVGATHGAGRNAAHAMLDAVDTVMMPLRAVMQPSTLH
jgi:NTE family protein